MDAVSDWMNAFGFSVTVSDNAIEISCAPEPVPQTTLFFQWVGNAAAIVWLAGNPKNSRLAETGFYITNHLFVIMASDGPMLGRYYRNNLQVICANFQRPR
jgi:hypothetical protein